MTQKKGKKRRRDFVKKTGRVLKKPTTSFDMSPTAPVGDLNTTGAGDITATDDPMLENTDMSIINQPQEPAPAIDIGALADKMTEKMNATFDARLKSLEKNITSYQSTLEKTYGTPITTWNAWLDDFVKQNAHNKTPAGPNPEPGAIHIDPNPKHDNDANNGDGKGSGKAEAAAGYIGLVEEKEEHSKRKSLIMNRPTPRKGSGSSGSEGGFTQKSRKIQPPVRHSASAVVDDLTKKHRLGSSQRVESSADAEDAGSFWNWFTY